MMKWWLFIGLIVSYSSFGQRGRVVRSNYLDHVRQGDSLEKAFHLDASFQIWNDTIPAPFYAESKIWKYWGLLTYFYDSAFVRRIDFKDGDRATYHFYFDRDMLRKVRILKRSINIQYYYSDEENSAKDPTVPGPLDSGDPDQVQRYKSLLKSRELLQRFRTASR